MTKVKNLIADSVTLHCPHCRDLTGSFFEDPSGQVYECEHCGKDYEIDKCAIDNISFQ